MKPSPASPEHLARVFQAPVITPPGGWTIGRNLYPTIIVQRIRAVNQEPPDPLTTEAEALAFIACASRVDRLNLCWYTVYIHLFSQLFPAPAAALIPSKDRAPALSPEAAAALEGLRRWIYDVQQETLARYKPLLLPRVQRLTVLVQKIPPHIRMFDATTKGDA